MARGDHQQDVARSIRGVLLHHVLPFISSMSNIVYDTQGPDLKENVDLIHQQCIVVCPEFVRACDENNL